MNPLVSVIIPCYNGLAFIRDTLASVLQQTYANLEIIVIDDNSKDGTYKYLENLNHSNLVLRKNKGKGACAARNFGLELAKGEYIQFLDADDLLTPNKISSQVSYLNNAPTKTVASCRWQHFVKYPGDIIDYKKQIVDKSYADPKEWLMDSWGGGGMGTIHGWLTPRILIEEVGFWDESLKINQDGEFFSRIILSAKRIEYIEDIVAYYRIGNPESLSQNKKFSYEKARSLLKSYILYKENAIQSNDFHKLRSGLGNNFLSFIYQFHGVYQDLCQQAEQEFKTLGYQKMWPIGGKKTKMISRLVGVKTTLFLRSFLLNSNIKVK